jgi:hypothetical protein
MRQESDGGQVGACDWNEVGWVPFGQKLLIMLDCRERIQKVRGCRSENLAKSLASADWVRNEIGETEGSRGRKLCAEADNGRGR